MSLSKTRDKIMGSRANNRKLFIINFLFVLLGMSLGACSTTMRIEKALDLETKKQLQIFKVSVTADKECFCFRKLW